MTEDIIISDNRFVDFRPLLDYHKNEKKKECWQACYLGIW